MVSPAPGNPAGQNSLADQVPATETPSDGAESITRQFLDTFGFQLLIVLLGIVLAFM